MKLDEHGLPDDTELTEEFLKELTDIINVVNRYSQKIKCKRLFVNCDPVLKPYISIYGNVEKDDQGQCKGFWVLYITNDGNIKKSFIH